MRSEAGADSQLLPGTYHIKIGCAACGECCGPLFHEADFGDAPAIVRARISAEADFADAGLVIRYLGERLYRDNPVLRHAHQLAEPVYWDEIWERGPANERERAFLEEFRKADLGDEVGVPVFGPDGRLGQCGLGLRKGVRRLDPEVLKQFQWVCELAHLRYCTLLVPGSVRGRTSRHARPRFWPGSPAVRATP